MKWMKQKRGLFLLALALVFPISGRAVAEGSVTQGVKIGTVDFQKALNHVTQGKQARDQLKGEFDAKQKKLNLQQDELKKMRDDFEKQKLALSEEAARQKEKDFNEKLMELQKNMATYQRDLATKEAKMTAMILQNLRQVVGDIAKQEKFILVVEKSGDAVLFAESQEDLTDRVIGLYNKKFTGSLNVQ